MPTLKKISLISLITILLLSGCLNHHENHDKTEHMEEKIEIEPIAITDYTEQTELFVEFDPFVINQPSTFLAHFTYMDTFKPFLDGRVEACLTYENRTKECFSVNKAASEGIFKPVATPTQSGDALLSISITLNEINVTHNLGSFKVYDSFKQIPVHEEEEDDSISYLKEQQWKVDFATQIAKKRLLHESISTFAKIEVPSNNEYILSAPIAGFITHNEEINVGSQVKKNMTVTYITPILGQKEDISTLKFELKKAEANLSLKKDENERVQKLKAINAVSQKRIFVAEQDYEMAKAQLVNVKQRLNRLETGSDKELGVSLKSAIDGKISKLLALPGSYVNEGDPIAHIVNSDKLWVNVNIPQSEISKINKPLGVELLTDDEIFKFIAGKDAKFIYFNDIIDPKTRCASLLFEIKDIPTSLKAGAGYAAKAYTGKTVDKLAIAKSAIVNDNGQHVVYVQTGGESFERRNVQTGLSAEGYIEIVSGVNAGEHVVSKGAYQVLLSAVSPAAAGAGHAH